MVPFKVIPLRYNIVVSALFLILKELLISTLWYSLELFQQFSFFSPQSQQICIFSWFSLVLETEKVAVGQVCWIWWLMHDYYVVLCEKNANRQWYVSWFITVLQKPWLVFPQFQVHFSYCFMHTAHKFKVICYIDRETFWKNLIMHHIVIKENGEQNFTFDQI